MGAAARAEVRLCTSTRERRSARVGGEDAGKKAKVLHKWRCLASKESVISSNSKDGSGIALVQATEQANDGDCVKDGRN